jgi:hypothetical protein
MCIFTAIAEFFTEFIALAVPLSVVLGRTVLAGAEIFVHDVVAGVNILAAIAEFKTELIALAVPFWLVRIRAPFNGAAVDLLCSSKVPTGHKAQQSEQE